MQGKRIFGCELLRITACSLCPAGDWGFFLLIDVSQMRLLWTFMQGKRI